ncbi:MAG: hypothetical protein AVDCRST_MAG55-2920, partial [uncultured Rubrobacteraceae bacterium]
ASRRAARKVRFDKEHDHPSLSLGRVFRSLRGRAPVLPGGPPRQPQGGRPLGVGHKRARPAQGGERGPRRLPLLRPFPASGAPDERLRATGRHGGLDAPHPPQIRRRGDALRQTRDALHQQPGRPGGAV